MINTLTIDIEATKLPFIHPWQKEAAISSVGLAANDEDVKTWIFDHATEYVAPHQDSINEIQKYVDACDLIIAHNAKFDLNWFKSIGINTRGKKVWCTLAADYLINGQYRVAYDLNSVAARHGLGIKIDLMKKYWDDGYDTRDIPLEVHIPYLMQDVNLTRAVYQKQQAIINANGLANLAALTFEITDMLSDMETRGVKFDKDAALKFHGEFSTKLACLEQDVFKLTGEFNIGSSQQLSAVLYGGKYKVDGREVYTVTLKDGTVKERSRKCRIDKVVEGFGFQPLDGTESEATPGVYSTGVKVLKLLRADTPEQERVLGLLKERSKVQKVIEMFMSKDMDGGLIPAIGKDGRIHPQFNQATTVTGRLSSKQPN